MPNGLGKLPEVEKVFGEGVAKTKVNSIQDFGLLRNVKEKMAGTSL